MLEVYQQSRQGNHIWRIGPHLAPHYGAAAELQPHQDLNAGQM